MSDWLVTGERIEQFDVRVKADSREEAIQRVRDEILQSGSQSEFIVDFYSDEPGELHLEARQ